MLARLQRLLVLSVLLCAALWLWWSGEIGISLSWRAFVTALILLPHAPVLAVEFVLLAQFGDHRPAPRPKLVTLFKAWLGEVIWGVETFGWRQPFRANAVPDHLPPASARRQGVLLVHGFVCNRGLWNPWMRRLRSAGVPFVAVNLEPVFGPIDGYADIIERAVHQLEVATGRPPLIVAHSMGGLATRRWLQRYQADRRCAGVLTIGSPHCGTWLARFAFSRNGRQMRRGNPWLAALAAEEPPARLADFTCFYGHCDNIVFPAATAMLPGADNRHLPGLAHVHLLSSPLIFDEVMRRLAAPEAGLGLPASPPPAPSA